MIGEHLPILVILTYCFAALLMPAAGAIHRRLPSLLAFAAGLGAFGLSVLTLLRTLRQGAFQYSVGAWPAPIGIELVADPLSAFFLLAVNLVALLVLFQMAFGTTERPTAAYSSCAMLMLGGFGGIIGTGDLFNLFVFLELSALAGYALLGCKDGRSAHAAFRYLLLGTLGASFYLLGLGFLYAETGSLNMGDLRMILETSGMDTASRIALVLMVTGMALKMALFPLHQWLPDTYTYAPPLSTALVAPIGTKVAVYVLIRIFHDVFPADLGGWDFPFSRILVGAGMIAIIWGSVMAIPQGNLKRMLAYSSVAQIGYIALGIGLATPYGFIGAVLHVFNHALMKACLFLFSARLEADGGEAPKIEELNRKTSREFPLASACFTVAAISMIGLPPMAGFFSKWYLILGCIGVELWIGVGVILASSLLNAAYFFRILERLYLKEDAEPAPAARPRVRIRGANLAMLLLGLLLVGAGLFNVGIVEAFLRPIVTEIGLG